MKRLRPKLTFANVISCLALFVALGSGAVAASHLGKNSVGPKQLKKNAVTTAKIKNEAITGAKVKKGSLTGTQINLSTLGTVPEAAHANSADHAITADHGSNADKVGGLSVVKFERTGTASLASPVTIVSLDGLRLDYACQEGPMSDTIDLRAITSVNGASLWLSRFGAEDTKLEMKDPFNSGDSFPLNGYVGTGVYTAPGGTVVTFTYRRSVIDCTSGVAGTAYGG
jgi:hypothetical protein